MYSLLYLLFSSIDWIPFVPASLTFPLSLSRFNAQKQSTPNLCISFSCLNKIISINNNNNNESASLSQCKRGGGKKRERVKKSETDRSPISPHPGLTTHSFNSVMPLGCLDWLRAELLAGRRWMISSSCRSIAPVITRTRGNAFSIAFNAWGVLGWDGSKRVFMSVFFWRERRGERGKRTRGKRGRGFGIRVRGGRAAPGLPL